MMKRNFSLRTTLSLEKWGEIIMKKEILLEVVSELVGYTEPYGDTNVDKVRYENQEKIIELVMNGIEDLINNAAYKDRPEYSMAQIGGRAYEALEKLHKIIEDNL